MNCEQGIDTSLGYKRIKKQYLENPGVFVAFVINDAEFAAKKGGPDFWIKIFTANEVAAMNNGELRVLVLKVEGFLKTDEGKRLDAGKCHELLGHLKTIAEARKEIMVPDL